MLRRYLESLFLPVRDEVLVVPSIQYLENRYLDMHIYTKDGWQWVIFIENSIVSNKRKLLQQNRLSTQLKSHSLRASFLKSMLHWRVYGATRLAEYLRENTYE